MFVKQISAFAENRPGALLNIITTLRDHQIDIRAMSLADTTDFGILRLIVSDPDAAVDALRSSGVTCSLTDVIAVELEDKPGSLFDIFTALAGANVSVEYTYAFKTPVGAKACCALRVDRNEEGVRALERAGVHIMSAQALYEL